MAEIEQRLAEVERKLNETKPRPQLWLSVEEAAPVIGDPAHSIYRNVREGTFPFDFVRVGKRIKISAKSLGLIGGETATA